MLRLRRTFLGDTTGFDPEGNPIVTPSNDIPLLQSKGGSLKLQNESDNSSDNPVVEGPAPPPGSTTDAKGNTTVPASYIAQTAALLAAQNAKNVSTYSSASSFTKYLPYIIGGVALLVVVMVATGGGSSE